MMEYSLLKNLWHSVNLQNDKFQFIEQKRAKIFKKSLLFFNSQFPPVPSLRPAAPSSPLFHKMS